MEQLAICDDCRAVWREISLTQPESLHSHAIEDGEEPLGECPDCGSLAYLIDKDDVFTDEEQLKMKMKEDK